MTNSHIEIIYRVDGVDFNSIDEAKAYLSLKDKLVEMYYYCFNGKFKLTNKVSYAVVIHLNKPSDRDKFIDLCKGNALAEDKTCIGKKFGWYVWDNEDKKFYYLENKEDAFEMYEKILRG